jgi:hypothetical protein
LRNNNLDYPRKQLGDLKPKTFLLGSTKPRERAKIKVQQLGTWIKTTYRLQYATLLLQLGPVCEIYATWDKISNLLVAF